MDLPEKAKQFLIDTDNWQDDTVREYSRKRIIAFMCGFATSYPLPQDKKLKAKIFLDKKQKKHWKKYGVYADTNSKIAEWIVEYANQEIDKSSTTTKRFKQYMRNQDLEKENERLKLEVIELKRLLTP